MLSFLSGAERKEKLKKKERTFFSLIKKQVSNVGIYHLILEPTSGMGKKTAYGEKDVNKLYFILLF